MSELPGGSEPERRSAEDAAWASIVQNFGERAKLTEDDVIAEPISLLPPQPEPTSLIASDEHFEPPEAPRVGLADGPRGVAWLGLLGAPTLLVIALLSGISIPHWLSLFAVVAFLGSLGYLVATMHGHDDDPWDDGARV